MDFRWSEQSGELYDAAVAFGRSELRESGGDVDARRERWRRAGAFGLLGLTLPEEHGGRGGTALEAVRLFEGAGYGAEGVGFLFAAGAHLWAVATPIRVHGTDEQRAAYLPGLASGERIGAFASSESEAGSDAGAIACAATRVDGGYRIKGAKTYVSNGPLADLFLVICTTDPAKGWRGQTALLVERRTEGLAVRAPMPTLGLEESGLTEVVFDDCFVPEGQRLGEEGGAGEVFQTAMTWERSLILGPQLGVLAAQLEHSVEHANDRRQFGRRIARFQAVSHRLADMAVRLESARLLTYRAAWALDEDDQADYFAAISKLVTSESAVTNHLDSMRVHGGMGYLKELPIERHLRDSLGGLIHSGTSDILRNLIALRLGL